MVRSIDSQVVDFLGTLDVGGDKPNAPSEEIRNRLHAKEFSSRDEFFQLARQIQQLGTAATTDEGIISGVIGLVRRDARFFLVLMHLHRNIRFTNLELVRILFDSERLDDVGYYHLLAQSDLAFSRAWRSAHASPEWAAGSSNRDHFELAVGKRVVWGYLDEEKDVWELWKSRINSDPEVARRLAEFVVRVEDLGELIREGAVETGLSRSLRTRNVEQVKGSRGKFGAGRVEDALKAASFVRLNRESTHPRLPEVDSMARRRLDEGPFYAAEVRSQQSDKSRKRFDFALAGKGGVRFVVETTYYSTAMSKVAEVVKDFRQLKQRVPTNLHLFFVTDGIGWFGRANDVSEMLQENEIDTPTPSPQFPFLLNLDQLTRLIPRIKLELSRGA